MTMTLNEAVRDYFNILDRGHWGVLRYNEESGKFWADEYVDQNSYTIYPENVKMVYMNKIEWDLAASASSADEFENSMTPANVAQYISQNLEWVTTP